MTLVQLFDFNITLIGFTSSSWNSNLKGSFIPDSTAALYKYEPNGNKTAFGVISSDYAIYNKKVLGPSFGRSEL